ncbi:MAG: acyltransferase [Hyphomicrobiales bacterium]|nr:acyltransferase [Hyphomicrobiales bacterium]
MYRKDIEGLRAVAVLSVLFFHFGAFWIPGGFTGVDIFFVISGYLITGTCIHDLDDGKFSITRFYWKRARRILPALTAVILVSTVVAYVVLLPADLTDYSWSVIASSTFWSNIFFWKTSNYFSPDAELRPLLHTWSLSVEEQFYIFAPVLIWFVYTHLQKRWALVLTPLVIASFALAVYATHTAPTAGFYLIATRAWELLLGAMLTLKQPAPVRSRAMMNALATAGLVLLCIGMFTIHASDPFPGINALYPCVGTALIIYAGQPAREQKISGPTYVTRLLSTLPLVLVGRISYSLYLVHWPIISFYRYASLDEPAAATALAMAAASIVLATLSYRYVEQPFRKPHAWSAPRPLLIGSAVSLCVLCALGSVGVLGKGFPSRYPDFVEVRIPGFDEWKVGTCFNDGSDELGAWQLEPCTRTHGFASKALLWGDSFAAHYVPGLAPNAEKLGANVIQYTYAGCPPILSYYSYARPKCSVFNRRVLELIAQEKIRTVVLSARWTDYQTRGFAGVQQTIKTLADMGVRVIVIGQSPQFAADIQKVAYAAKRRGDTSDMAPLKMDAQVNLRLAEASVGATFIDPLKSLCSGDACPYRDSSGFYYADYGHFSTLGAAHAIARYWPSLK